MIYPAGLRPRRRESDAADSAKRHNPRQPATSQRIHSVRRLIDSVVGMSFTKGKHFFERALSDGRKARFIEERQSFAAVDAEPVERKRFVAAMRACPARESPDPRPSRLTHLRQTTPPCS